MNTTLADRTSKQSMRSLLSGLLLSSLLAWVEATTCSREISKTVYVCGLNNYTVVASALYPERKQQLLENTAGIQMNTHDILIAGGGGGCDSVAFPGKVLYVDGESGELDLPEIFTNSQIYYLGVSDFNRPSQQIRASLAAAMPVGHLTLRIFCRTFRLQNTCKYTC